MKHTFKKVFSRIVSGVLAAASAVTMTAGMNFSASAAAGARLYNQWDSQWKTVRYYDYSSTQNSLYDSGCGVFAFCNAMYSLNGSVLQPKDVGRYAIDVKAYYPGSGGFTLPGNFYNKVNTKYGSTYNVQCSGYFTGAASDTRLKNHLKAGGVAVACVPGHYIAITDYNASNNQFYVVESAVSNSRNLSATGWVTEYKLTYGTKDTNKTKVLSYGLLSKTNTTPVPPVPPTGFKTMKNYQSGKMLNVVSNSSASGANVTVYQQDGTTGQNFRLNAHGGTKSFGGVAYQKYTIEAQCAPKCRLNVYGSTSVSGNNVNLWSTSGNDTQDWILQPSPYGGAGYYIIRSANNTSCVLTEAGTGNGSNVMISTYQSGNKNQIWYLGTL